MDPTGVEDAVAEDAIQFIAQPPQSEAQPGVPARNAAELPHMHGYPFPTEVRAAGQRLCGGTVQDPDRVGRLMEHGAAKPPTAKRVRDAPALERTVNSVALSTERAGADRL